MRILWSLVFLFLLQYLPAQNQWTLFNSSNSALPDNVIRCLAKDAQGNVWIGTDNGVAKFDGNTFTVIDSSNSDLPVNQIRSIAFDTSNHLWVGTLQAGVAVFDGSNWINYTSQNSALPDDQVRTIAFDTAGDAWLGTTGGVVHISSEGWEVYGMFNSPLASNNINHIFVQDATIWVGTVNGGLSRKVGSVWNTYTHQNSGMLDNTAYHLTDDIFGNLWFATPAQGLGRYNGNGWYFRSISNSGLPTNGLSAIEVVKHTDVKYIGTIDKGLVRWTNGLPFDSFTVNNSPMPDNHVTCLLQYNDSTFYIGTASSGLVKFVDTTQYPLVSAVKELNDAAEIMVYPNPATVFISLSNVIANASVSISDAMGREVLQSFTVNNYPIDISDLAAGVYFLQIRRTGEFYRVKFIKE
ncbi:MAG: two-component regulator propeller domain-containing protein [Chitinophagales bacterium]